MKIEFHDMDVGRDGEGRVVFAGGGLPGESAQVALTQANKSFGRGQITSLETVSPHRIAPPCPYFVRCGGCDWQHCDYNEQVKAKRSKVVQTLSRIGGFERETLETLVAPCVPSPRPFAYRNKADFVVAAAVKAERQNGFEVGFFERGSHQIVDIEACPIQVEANNVLLKAARESLRRGMVSPFDAKSGRGVLRRLVMRTASDGSCLLIAVTTREKWLGARQWARWMRAQSPALRGVLQRETRGEHQVEARILDGVDWLEETVGDLRLRVGGDGFFQINASLTPELVSLARRMMAIESGENCVDLFCGVGLFALSMARDGARVLGIESSARAIEDARHNASANALKAEFQIGDAAAKLGQLKAGEWDKVLLDPPREGALSCREPLLRLAPRALVYISCDVATLARDLKVLSGAYQLREVVPLDLFPQTAHVETVAYLVRRRA
jgi:23S rRNA (uracil1939-C5)-methyltransferase